MQTGKEYEGDRTMELQKKALQIRSLDGNDRQDVSFYRMDKDDPCKMLKVK